MGGGGGVLINPLFTILYATGSNINDNECDCSKKTRDGPLWCASREVGGINLSTLTRVSQVEIPNLLLYISCPAHQNE